MLDELKNGDNRGGWEAADENDPNRCLGQDKHLGQCRYKAVPGSKYCPRHKGDLAIRAQEKENLRQYKIGIYEQRYKEFATDPEIKSLRQEIGITRMLLEELFKRCQGDNPNTLLVHLPRIDQTTERIRKLVESCHRMEEKLAVSLDRAVVLQIAETIVVIVNKHVDDPQLLETLSGEIFTAITGKVLNNV